MHGLSSRHRRKAGSGPPANALIAWIGADPHLRSVGASHRRGTDLALPSHTRAAKVAVAACFVLTGGAVLGITTAVNDGLLAPLASSPSPVLTQDNAAPPGQIPARAPATGSQPDPTVLPAPAPITTESMVANPQTPQHIPAAPATTQSGHVAVHDPGGSPVGHVGSSVAAPATHPVSPHRADPPHPARPMHPDGPIAPIQPTGADKPGPTVTPATSAGAVDSANPTDPGKLAGSDHPADTGNPAGTGNSMDPSDPADSADPPGTVGRGDTGKPAGGGKPVASSVAGGGEGTHNSIATRGVEESPSAPRRSTFSQKPTSTQGPISDGGPTASTSGRGSAQSQRTRGPGVWMFGIAVGLLIDDLAHQ